MIEDTELELAQKEYESDLQHVLKTAQGKRVFARLLDSFGIFTSSYTGDEKTFFLEGRRNAGLQILADCVNAYPESAVDLLVRKKV